MNPIQSLRELTTNSKKNKKLLNLEAEKVDKSLVSSLTVGWGGPDLLQRRIRGLTVHRCSGSCCSACDRLLAWSSFNERNLGEDCFRIWSHVTFGPLARFHVWWCDCECYSKWEIAGIEDVFLIWLNFFWRYSWSDGPFTRFSRPMSIRPC